MALLTATGVCGVSRSAGFSANAPKSISVQFSSTPALLSALTIASLVPHSSKLLGSRPEKSLAVVSWKLCTIELPTAGVTMKPEPAPAKFRYLVTVPSTTLSGPSGPG